MSKKIAKAGTHTKCQVEGCLGTGNISKGRLVFPRGYCTKHYWRFKKNGDISVVTKIVGEVG